MAQNSTRRLHSHSTHRAHCSAIMLRACCVNSFCLGEIYGAMTLQFQPNDSFETERVSERHRPLRMCDVTSAGKEKLV